LYDEDEGAIGAMVNEVDTDADDKINLEIEGDIASEESSSNSQKVRLTKVVRVLMGGKF
jgi:hypothetical protein